MRKQSEAASAGGELQRRGLLAGVAALVAAGLAKVLSAERADAGHDAVTAPTATNVLHLGVINDGGNAANDETATNVTARTALVADISGGANAALRVRNLGSGGAGLHTFGASPGGDGLVGTGGAMSGAVGADDGRGVVAIGGNHQVTGVDGGIGLDATGGTSQDRTGGRGARIQGGASSTGAGGAGLQAFGGAGTPPGVGVEGRGGGPGGSQATGVLGLTNSSSATTGGVVGQNTSTGPGVLGQSGATGTGAGSGVSGQSGTGPGVLGQSGSGFGVQGVVPGAGTGVRGDAGSAGTGVDGRGGTGVVGIATNPDGSGVLAFNPSGVALRADTVNGQGFLGVTTGGGLAGRFVGRTIVEGQFEVFGPKSAVVPHPDGHHRRLYCMESPESWFEDFGKGQVVNGRATVRLDGDFAAVVHSNDYLVFPVAEGDCNGLYVSSKTPTSFEVREVKGGTSTLPFSYRVVAKRKDIAGPRLERVVVPPRPADLPAHVRPGPGDRPAPPARPPEPRPSAP
jgi:hypothetical protein